MDLFGSLKMRIGEMFDAFVREQEVELCRKGFAFLEQKLPDKFGQLRPDFEAWAMALRAGGPPPAGNRFQQLITRFPQMRGMLTSPALAEISKDLLAHFIQEMERRAGDVPVVPPPIPVNSEK